MKKTAVYPGTFDPVTLGHMDVIKASAAIFDEVVVGILINSNKQPMFPEGKRAIMIERAVRDSKITNVRVEIFNGLTVELAQQENALAIIRGLRLTTEYEDELGLIFNNMILDGGIISVLIPPRQEHIHISSSAVRELLKFGRQKLDKYVPPAVLEYLA